MAIIPPVTGEVYLVEPDTGEVDELGAVPGIVTDGSVSPDGAIAAVRVIDDSIALYDVDDMAAIGSPVPIEPGDQYLPGMRWSEDSTTLWFSAASGPVALQVEPESSVRRACDIAGRDLAEEEWRRNVSDTEPYQPVCGSAGT